MIYFISGLGADERVFQFLDLPNQAFQHIHWITPQRKESLAQYASKLIQQINTEEEVILIGVSFGGMIAQEIARKITCKKVIIISSVKSPDEFSWQMKLVRQTKAHYLAPTPLLKWSNLLTANYYFSVTAPEEKKLLRQIVLDTDTNFMVWAIHAIMSWQNKQPLENLIHIHGTSDRIFPIKPIKGAHLINGGGHFMIVNRAEEISQFIMNQLT